MPIRDEILQDLTHNTSNLSTLDLSNQELTVDDIKILLNALVSNTNILRLNLANNSLGDEGAFLLADQLKISELNVSYNGISDEGIKAFIENDYLDSITIKGNNFTFMTRKQLDQKTSANYQAKISQLATSLSVLSQGRGQVTSPWSLLSTDLIFNILSYTGTSLCSGAALNKIATIIFNNINYDCHHQKRFHWEEPAEKIFRFPGFFSIPKTYTPMVIENTKHNAPHER